MTPRVVTVKLYDPTNTTQVLVGGLNPLDDVVDANWQERRGEITTGTVVLGLEDAGRAAMTPGRIVRYLVDGVAKFATLVGRPDTIMVSDKEDVGETSTYQMLNLLGLWAEVAVEPELGDEVVSPATRQFGLASKYLDISAWIAATQIKLQSDHTGTQWNQTDGHTGPAGWKDPTAYWIACRAQTGGSPPFPVGSFPLAKEYTLAAEKLVGFDFTADDGYEIFVDGEPLAADLTSGAWGQTRSAQRFQSAGTHRIVVWVTNLARASVATNVCGFILAWWEMLDGGATRGTLIGHTDSSWVCLDMPATRPTMTPGHIIRVLLEEAQARGTMAAPSPLAGVTLNFSDTLDSAGNAWATPVDVIVNVGDPTLNVLRLLIETSIDVRMSATGLVLSAWNKGTMGTTKSVTLAKGTNLSAAQTQGQPTLGTAGLYQDARGIWHWRESANIATSGRVEFGVQLGSAPNADQAARTIDAVFALTDTPVDHATYAYEEDTGSLVYNDWDLGDTITAIDETSAAASIRVEGFTCSRDANGFLVVSGIEGRP